MTLASSGLWSAMNFENSSSWKSPGWRTVVARSLTFRLGEFDGLIVIELVFEILAGGEEIEDLGGGYDGLRAGERGDDVWVSPLQVPKAMKVSV